MGKAVSVDRLMKYLIYGILRAFGIGGYIWLILFCIASLPDKCILLSILCFIGFVIGILNS